MAQGYTVRTAVMALGCLALTACDMGEDAEGTRAPAADEPRQSRLQDLLIPREEPGRVGQVNRYLWGAALDVLDFLPVEAVDPFTGVITTGFGTPPGGGRAYRATIYISDAALDARSLNLSLLTRSGPVDADTLRAVEDAILLRARQQREADGAF